MYGSSIPNICGMYVFLSILNVFRYTAYSLLTCLLTKKKKKKQKNLFNESNDLIK